MQKAVFSVAVVDGTGPMSAERRRGKMKAEVWGALSIPPAHFAAGGQKKCGGRKWGKEVEGGGSFHHWHFVESGVGGRYLSTPRGRK